MMDFLQGEVINVTNTHSYITFPSLHCSQGYSDGRVFTVLSVGGHCEGIISGGSEQCEHV